MWSKTLSCLYQAHSLIYYEPDCNTPLIFVLRKAVPIAALLLHYNGQNNGWNQYKGLDKLHLTICLPVFNMRHDFIRYIRNETFRRSFISASTTSLMVPPNRSLSES